MRPVFEWNLGSRSLQLGKRTRVMGVINVTPDSFSDGGLNLDRDAAVKYGLQLLKDGADILDVGGESTRPGAKILAFAEPAGENSTPVPQPHAEQNSVSEKEELKRV